MRYAEASWIATTRLQRLNVFCSQQSIFVESMGPVTRLDRPNKKCAGNTLSEH